MMPTTLTANKCCQSVNHFKNHRQHSRVIGRRRRRWRLLDRWLAGRRQT